MMANSEFLKSLVGRDLNINGSSSNKKIKTIKRKALMQCLESCTM